VQVPLEPTTILTPQPLTLDTIPLLGFGTWNLDRENASAAVSWAIQTGYRHIDCAAAYKNQDLVGKGIADGLAKTGLKREDLWITSKLWNDQYASAFRPFVTKTNIVTAMVARMLKKALTSPSPTSNSTTSTYTTCTGLSQTQLSATKSNTSTPGMP